MDAAAYVSQKMYPRSSDIGNIPFQMDIEDTDLTTAHNIVLDFAIKRAIRSMKMVKFWELKVSLRLFRNPAFATYIRNVAKEVQIGV